jgi:hypothetical protein
MKHPSRSPNFAVRLALTGAGSAVTIAAAVAVWLQLSLHSLGSVLQPQRSAARLRRGRAI